MEQAAEEVVEQSLRVVSLGISAGALKTPGTLDKVVVGWDFAQPWAESIFQWILENEPYDGGTARFYPFGEEKQAYYDARDAFEDCLEDFVIDAEPDNPDHPTTDDEGFSTGCLECSAWQSETIGIQRSYDEETEEYTVTSGIDIVVCSDWTYTFDGLDSNGDGFCDE